MAKTRKGLTPAVRPRHVDYSLRRVLWIALSAKVAVIALIYLGHLFFRFNLANYQVNFIYPPGESPNLWTPLKTWDGQIYLYLADHGYGPHQFTNAFYPLFPFLIRVAGLLLDGNNLLGGLLISHLFVFLSMIYLYRWMRENFDERTTFYGCLFVLAFPTGFFLGFLYSESVFLTLAAGYFYYWSHKKTGWAIFCAFLLPLSRPTGVLVFLPALIAAWVGRQGKQFWISKWLPALGFLAGYAGYLGFMRMTTGNAFAAFDAEKTFIAHFALNNIFHPVDWFARIFFQLDPSFPFTTILLLNRIFFILFLWALWVCRKFLTKPLFVYCLVLGLVPALSGELVTYLRYLLVLFPLFPVLALKWKGKELFYLAPSLALQAYLAMQQALNYFVS